VSVGYGSAYGGGYYDPYYDDRYYGRSRYGSYGGYGYSPYYGWNNGFIIRHRLLRLRQYRRPYRWNDNQRRYWEDRRRTFRGYDNRADRRELRENWQEFRQERRMDDRAFRQERRTIAAPSARAR
jgi:hypothetical protein